MPIAHTNELPVPDFFDPVTLERPAQVPYQERALLARRWATSHGITAASNDVRRIGLLCVDVQNTFCLPGSDLFVRGAVEDSGRLCSFVYRNLHRLTHIVATLDTHRPLHIFHSMFWVDPDGVHPAPFTQITLEQFEEGKWRPATGIALELGMTAQELESYALYYLQQLRGRYPLMIWPYHSMLGGVGHALVAGVEEAIFFHSMARRTSASLILKGTKTLTENYSALRPEVIVEEEDQDRQLMDQLLGFDMLIVAGQAKSHCVAWTMEDLLGEIRASDESMARRVYLLEDCMSPVVVPGQDFTEHAAKAFRRFADAGMHVVRSTEAMHLWP